MDIPAIVVDLDSPTVHEVQIVENLEREHLNPIDQAHAFQRLQREYNYSDTALAQRLRRSPRFIRNRIDLLKLDPRVQQLVAQGRIAIASALELLRLDDSDTQFEVARQVEHDNLTAPATAARVNRYKFEQRLLASKASRRLSLERKTQTLAEQGVVITPGSFDPEKHHRTWDLIFSECRACRIRGMFLRDDGQVEDVCVEPECYGALLAQRQEFNARQGRLRHSERRKALERVLDSDDVTTPHLQYLLWALLDLMGPEADPWRSECGLPVYSDAPTMPSAEWALISIWSDEQVLTHIMRLCVGHIAVLSNSRLPTGLIQSLTEHFGVSPTVLENSPITNEAS